MQKDCFHSSLRLSHSGLGVVIFVLLDGSLRIVA
ncbi:Uncharacterised protein [Rhodococcus gordoniae]|uniref:Uncharacterized protein n=1 Tax=Rhodococcus gordoniae TaxID=223392 RepID=A0A379M3B8_9NOCA|nr:Uncharacterised protein [Rhodococcus gordoniae]